MNSDKGTWKLLRQGGSTAAYVLTGIVMANVVIPAHGASRDQSIFADNLQLRLGVFWPELNSSGEVSGKAGQGARLDFERHLGLDENKTTIYGGLTWNVRPRHTLELEYFDLSRDAVKTAAHKWNIGDTTVLAGGRIDTSFKLSITRLTYGYAIFEREKHLAHIIAGVHYARLQADLLLSGELILNGEPVFVQEGEPIAELDSTEAPLPHFGLDYSYAISPDWTAHTSVMGLDLSIDNYDGTLIEANVSVQYQINKHIGIGAGLKYFDIDVSRKKKDKDYQYDFEFYGPAVFFTATF
jgi:hypothetical protein